MSAQSFIERSPPAPSSPIPARNPAINPNPFAAPSTFTLPDNPATRTISLRNFGEQALKRIKLDTDSEAEFRTYIEMPNQEERNAMQFLHTLRVEALLDKSLQVRISTWKSSPSLLKNIRKFIWAILFLPNVQWYAGTVENTIISMQQAMRNSNISDLPPLESTECDILVKDVAREYSVQRSTLKKQITETIGKKIDIATLTADLLAHSSSLYPGPYNTVFWPNVDKALAEMRQEGPDAVVSVLQIVYEDDIKTHGDPAKSQHKTGNGVGTGSPKWLQQLHALAPLVQRFSRRQGTKRRRPASFDEEEEDNRDGDEPEEPNRESGGDQPDHVEGDGGGRGQQLIWIHFCTGTSNSDLISSVSYIVWNPLGSVILSLKVYRVPNFLTTVPQGISLPIRSWNFWYGGNGVHVGGAKDWEGNRQDMVEKG
ncbi:hypothetical protein B0H14DRAFT_2573485 [Mycena olivaceomarginata]|nr:hypothetical protein B0H14DRAFT_2573485 [Mycena olivaceomarginata]